MKLILVATLVAALSISWSAAQVWKDSPREMMKEKLQYLQAKKKTTPNHMAMAAEPMQRLPLDLMPTKQEVAIRSYLEIPGNYTTKGFIRINFDCINATNVIKFHMADIKTYNQTIRVGLCEGDCTNHTVPELPFVRHEYYANDEMYSGTMENEFVPGNSYFIEMEYQGYLNDRLVGFYRSSYTNQNGDTVYLGTTQMESTDARRAFPCFDEPSFKIPFQVVLLHASGVDAISNMQRVARNYDPDNGVWFDRFALSPPMSSYLVAFVVSDFVSIDSTFNEGSKPFRVWSRLEAIGQTTYAAEKGPEILDFFQEYYAVPFPLPKMDLVALPDFDAGAMENWGLVTFRERYLTYDSQLSSASDKFSVVDVISHELAHMWFGDLVTMEWWSDIWLNEGFASYMEFPGVNAVEPTMQAYEQFNIINLFYAFTLDAMESSHPISYEVNNPVEISQMFDGISYSKGASIIRMMSYFLTEATFQQGLHGYLTTHEYANANQDDLWRAMTLQAISDGTLGVSVTVGVKGIMDTWTLQKGYPVITITFSKDKTGFLARQERFLLVKDANSTDTHDYAWWVPLTWTDSISHDFNQLGVNIWMSDDEGVRAHEGMNPDADWVLFNVDQQHYYRVNYDIEHWQMLVDQLNLDHTIFTNNTRAQLLDDSMNLARAIPGRLNYSFALPVNDYLSNELGYSPWVAALDNLGYLEEMFTMEPEYESLRTYMLDLLSPLYSYVTFQDNLQDDFIVQRTRSLAVSWACHLGMAECVANSVDLFSTWMTDPTYNPISPNLKSSVYCTGVAEGGQAEWDFEYQRYLTENLASEILVLLAGMGCSRDETILENYLNLAFLTVDSPIRRQDAYKVFSAVASNDYGNQLSWDYINANWADLVSYVGYSEVTDYIYYSAREFNTQEELDELQSLYDTKKDEMGSSGSSVLETIEIVTNNIAWTDLYYDEIAQWLSEV